MPAWPAARRKLVVGQVREAIDVFERVNPKSARYAVAMCLAGQNYWRLYLTEKLKIRRPTTTNRWPPTAPRRSSD